MRRLHAVVSDLFLKHMHQTLTGAAAANGIEAVRSNAIVETLACRPNSPTTMKLHIQTTSVQMSSKSLKSHTCRYCSSLYSSHSEEILRLCPTHTRRTNSPFWMASRIDPANKIQQNSTCLPHIRTGVTYNQQVQWSLHHFSPNFPRNCWCNLPKSHISDVHPIHPRLPGHLDFFSKKMLPTGNSWGIFLLFCDTWNVF